MRCTEARLTLAEVQAAEWEAYKAEFNKTYDEEQDPLRRQVFEDNKQIIDEHNARFAQGKETYEMGVNQFTDFLEDEFNGNINGMVSDDIANLGLFHGVSVHLDDIDVHETETELETDNDHVDWRKLGAVTPVQHQGHFNNSWAFAAAGAVESREYLVTGKLVPLSKQNLVDCCRSKHRRTLSALKCIKKMGGIDTEASYHYRGKAHRCHYKKKHAGAVVSKIYQSRPGDENSLAHNVAKGPVAAVISREALRFYRRGVFHNPRCGQTPDYAVLVVGYGYGENSGDYWILKTSLGTAWGEQGYLRLARNRQNLCGISNRAYFPIVSK